MAHLQGYGAASVGNMINHYTRHMGDPNQTKYRYKNQNIDRSRTGQNYNLGPVRKDPAAFVRSQIDRVDAKPRGGDKETKVISDWVITLPKNPQLVGREREFFEQVYKFMCEHEKVPEKLIVGAWVHMDETQPHMHFCFCPVKSTPVTTNDKAHPLKNKDGSLKRDSNGTVRYRRVKVLDENGQQVKHTSFGQSKIYTRNKLKQFHPALEKELSEHFGFAVGVELDESKTIEKALSAVPQNKLDVAREQLQKQLQEETAGLESDIAHLENQRNALIENVGEERSRLEGLQRSRIETQSRVERLEERVRELRAARDGRVDRVSKLESIITKIRNFEALGRSGKLECLKGLTRTCNEYLEQVRERTKEVKEILKGFSWGTPSRPRQPQQHTLVHDLAWAREQVKIQKQQYHPPVSKSHDRSL